MTLIKLWEYISFYGDSSVSTIGKASIPYEAFSERSTQTHTVSNELI